MGRVGWQEWVEMCHKQRVPLSATSSHWSNARRACEPTKALLSEAPFDSSGDPRSFAKVTR